MLDSFQLILCDSSSAGTRWKDLLSQISFLPNPPRFVLLSPTETRSLWAEAFNLGAEDVLATPLDRSEVRLLIGRMLPMHHVPATAKRAQAAASSVGA
jgi:hypothetical protein